MTRPSCERCSRWNEPNPPTTRRSTHPSFRRIATASAAALLGLCVAVVPATMAAADTTTTTSTTVATPTTTTTDPNAPVVANVGNDFTITLPGIGTLTFTVDPATGAVSGLLVVPVDGSGFTAGTPVATAEGVAVVFTSATATRVLEVEVHMTDSGPMVTAEVDVSEPDDVSTGDDPHDSTTGSQGDHGDEGNYGAKASDDDASSTPTTTSPSVPKTDDNSAGDHGDDDGSESHVPSSTTSTTSTPGVSDDTSGDSSHGDPELGHTNVFGH